MSLILLGMTPEQRKNHKNHDGNGPVTSCYCCYHCCLPLLCSSGYDKPPEINFQNIMAAPSSRSPQMDCHAHCLEKPHSQQSQNDHWNKNAPKKSKEKKHTSFTSVDGTWKFTESQWVFCHSSVNFAQEDTSDPSHSRWILCLAQAMFFTDENTTETMQQWSHSVAQKSVVVSGQFSLQIKSRLCFKIVHEEAFLKMKHKPIVDHKFERANPAPQHQGSQNGNTKVLDTL